MDRRDMGGRQYKNQVPSSKQSIDRSRRCAFLWHLRHADGAERQLLQVCQLREYERMFLKGGIVRML